ncbi:hypothetical protein GGP41_000191 [Bipolaris sorokiniana]|uniref:Uncharacterized protein n=1 Tax=Cochliobolus sativus TaxID=45130 RepID=A0A8H5ZFW9_COCSA|nr:hypothetical protein GGP41_000191 [Bipolaris sorokiniana]
MLRDQKHIGKIEGHGFCEGRYQTLIRDNEYRKSIKRWARFAANAVSTGVETTKSTQFGKVHTITSSA